MKNLPCLFEAIFVRYRFGYLEWQSHRRHKVPAAGQEIGNSVEEKQLKGENSDKSDYLN